eukprot:116963_1
MPYYFTCCDESYEIFTGVDAKENDLLAQWGWEQDILFHVGGMSGGHIYLRTANIINKKLFKSIKKLSDFESLLNIPTDVIEECMQLSKQYSSKGRKEKAVQIHITPWLNIKKYDGDNHGTVQFVDLSMIKTLKTSTDKNMIDLLQESRTKKKMKEDDFRKQRDAKYQCNACNYYNFNFSNHLRFNMMFQYNNYLFQYKRMYPLVFMRYGNFCNVKWNLFNILLRRIVL